MATILVVDDMPIFRDPIAASLRLAGHKTHCAANGQEALDAVRRYRPDLVLLDVAMPVMDGITCLRALRADPEVGKTPVILLTAVSDKKYVIEAGRLGIQDYLLKSNFSLKELLARISKYTGQSAKAPPTQPQAAATPSPSAPSHQPAEKVDKANAAPSPVGSSSDPAIPRLLTREQCIARAEKALSAKTLSGAVAEVVAMAASPRTNASDLAPLIARDPMLSARVLQAANSAAYVSSRPVVNSIPDAVRQIGTAQVRNIAAALGVFDVMPPSERDGFNPIRCWQHSFAVAMLCERLANKDSADAGLAYLVGLCHDLGEILFHTHFGKECGRIVEAYAATGRPLDELERLMLGMTRGELVQTIIGALKLPDAIKEPIRAFHEGIVGPGASGALTRLLRAANYYANGLLLASNGRATVSPMGRAECRQAFGKEEPHRPDMTYFRSEVFYTAGVLARLSQAEAEELMKPPYERRPAAKLWVVREKSYSPFDPLVAALESLAEVRVSDSLSDTAAARECNGLVVIAPSDLAPEFGGPDIQLAVGKVRQPLKTLWLVGRVNGLTLSSSAALKPVRWPVRLDELDRFVGSCLAGAAGQKVAAAA